MPIKDRLVKNKNIKFDLAEIDIKRMQAVIDGTLGAEWVSTDEILAINDKLYDALAGKLQTHLGVLTVQ